MQHIRAVRIAAAAAAILLPITVVRASDPPKLKEGLWEIRGQLVEQPADKHSEFTYRVCRDHAYDKAADAALKNVQGCKTLVKDLGDAKFASASTCTVDGTTIVSNGLSLYKKNTSVHSESRAAYSPSLNGKSEETMTQDQQYIGKCPKGMKPGDRIAPDGIVRHHD